MATIALYYVQTSIKSGPRSWGPWTTAESWEEEGVALTRFRRIVKDNWATRRVRVRHKGQTIAEKLHQ